MANLNVTLISEAKTAIPSVDDILDEALERLSLTPEDIESEFSDILVSIDDTATEIYRNYEKEALIKLAKMWIERKGENLKSELSELAKENNWDRFIGRAKKTFVEFGILVQALEKDLGNKRKARGGATFQKVVLQLLNRIGVLAESPRGSGAKLLQRVDIVVPSAEVALNTPDRAFYLACKRTLRERWKQAAPEGGPQRRIYLITIDDSLSESKATEIHELGFIAFVRNTLAEELNKSWIRKLSDLPEALRAR